MNIITKIKLEISESPSLESLDIIYNLYMDIINKNPQLKMEYENKYNQLTYIIEEEYIQPEYPDNDLSDDNVKDYDEES